MDERSQFDTATKELTPKYSVEEVEKKIVKYYNDTHLGACSSGQYVVIHDETTVEDTICKVVVRFQQADNQTTPIADVSMNLFTGNCTISSRTLKKEKSDAPISGRNITCIYLTIAALLAWLFMPFVAITGYQKGEQPSALQTIIGDFTFLGEVYETHQFWIAVGLAFCMIICLICLVRKAGGAARVSAFLGVLIMSPIVVRVIQVSYDVAEGFTDFVGAGYWIILVLLLIIACVSEKQN